MLLLRPAVQSVEMEKRDKSASGPLYALKRAGHLSLTKNMALLSVTFFYTGKAQFNFCTFLNNQSLNKLLCYVLLFFIGLELSFFSGVYSPSIGFTKQMGENAKQLVGLSGIFIGLGEVIGEYSFLLHAKCICSAL